MGLYEVEVSRAAESDLLGIGKYISIRFHDSMTAMRMLKILETEIEKLRHRPLSSAVVRDELLGAKGYRTVKVKSYLIFYRIDDQSNTVVIIRILRERRNWRQIL